MAENTSAIEMTTLNQSQGTSVNQPTIATHPQTVEGSVSVAPNPQVEPNEVVNQNLNTSQVQPPSNVHSWLGEENGMEENGMGENGIGEHGIGEHGMNKSSSIHQNVSNLSPDAILNELYEGHLYSILANGKKELFIYKGLSTAAKVVSTSATQRYHDFIYLGPEFPIDSQQILIKPSPPQFARHPQNFLNNLDIKFLTNETRADPHNAALMMVFSPYFGYQRGVPKELKTIWNRNHPKGYYYIDLSGSCSAEMRDFKQVQGIPDNFVTIHRPLGSKGPTAQYIKNGSYNVANLNVVYGFAKKEGYIYNGGGKSKKHLKKYKSKSKRNKYI